jgi:small acid-soluble spore protein O (minor)
VLFLMSKIKNDKLMGTVNNKHAVRENLSREFDHEFANEPLSEAEKANNKKTKKRQ